MNRMACVLQAGIYVMTLFDWYSGGLNVILVALFEVCGIAWIYGSQPIALLHKFVASVMKIQRLIASTSLLKILTWLFDCVHCVSVVVVS